MDISFTCVEARAPFSLLSTPLSKFNHPGEITRSVHKLHHLTHRVQRGQGITAGSSFLGVNSSQLQREFRIIQKQEKPCWDSTSFQNPCLIVARAAHPSSPAGYPGPSSIPDDSFMDSISRWIWHRIKPPSHEHRTKDLLAWLPASIHDRLHNCEATAVVIVRELLLLCFAFAVFRNADSICRKLNWVWSTYGRKDVDVTEEAFQQSGFYALVVPLQFFTIILSITRHIREGFPRIKIPVDPHVIGQIRSLAFVATVTWFLIGWKNRVFDNWKQSTANRKDRSRLAAADRLLSLLVIIMGAFTAAETLGVPLRSVTAFGGITGIAIGLASKEVVTNFFGGLVLWLTRPFVIGDAIKAGQFAGIVQDVGFFQTKLRGFDKSLITVPNQVFTNMVITNMSRAQHRNLEVTLELRHQDILKLDELTKKITTMLQEHSGIDPTGGRPVCYVKSINNLSVIVAISAATKAMSSADFYQIQQNVLVKATRIIIDEGAFLGMNSPFPPVDVQLYNGSLYDGVQTNHSSEIASELENHMIDSS